MKLRFACFVAITLLFSNAALAIGTYTGTVSKVVILSANGALVFVEVSGTKTGSPSCSTNATFGFVMSLSGSPHGEMYLMLLAARAAGTSVTLQGTGACADYSTVESLATIYY
jgi:hypothetical protein